MPWVNRPAKGSSTSRWPVSRMRAGEEARSTAGAGSRARCRRYTGRPAASDPPPRAITGSAAAGEQNRAKYQELSTKVSNVSVSRRAGPPQRGQATCFQVGWWSSGLPGRSNATSSGSITGNCSSGTGTTPQDCAVDHRDRAAPVALAADAPVAQPPVGHAFADAPPLQRLDRAALGGVDVQPVQEAGIDDRAGPT